MTATEPVTGHETTIRGPSTDVRSFRGAYRAIAASVAVILTDAGAGSIRGLTCTSAVSLSAQPPLALVCVDLRTGFRDLVRESGRFSINYLAEDYARIAAAFAGNNADLSSLAHAIVRGRTDVPTLAFGTVSTIECSLAAEIRAGDHWILSGHINHSRYQHGERPLVYSEGRYAGVDRNDPGSGGTS